MNMIFGIKTVELRKTLKGKKYLYEAVEDGKVFAVRLSNRNYVAAICYTNDRKIKNGIGRTDLIANAVQQAGVVPQTMRIALITE